MGHRNKSRDFRSGKCRSGRQERERESDGGAGVSLQSLPPAVCAVLGSVHARTSARAGHCCHLSGALQLPGSSWRVYTLGRVWQTVTRLKHEKTGCILASKRREMYEIIQRGGQTNDGGLHVVCRSPLHTDHTPPHIYSRCPQMPSVKPGQDSACGLRWKCNGLDHTGSA